MVGDSTLYPRVFQLRGLRDGSSSSSYRPIRYNTSSKKRITQPALDVIG